MTVLQAPPKIAKVSNFIGGTAHRYPESEVKRKRFDERQVMKFPPTTMNMLLKILCMLYLVFYDVV